MCEKINDKLGSWPRSHGQVTICLGHRTGTKDGRGNCFGIVIMEIWRWAVYWLVVRLARTETG